MIRINAPIKLISPNKKFHHMTLYKKQKKMTEPLKFMLNLEKRNLELLPVHVRITRYSKKEFDWDNYITACKPIRDCIADFIIPGKAPGQADSSPDIYWHYYQEKLKKGENENILVEIFEVQK
jgi:hypothetical protein